MLSTEFRVLPLPETILTCDACPRSINRLCNQDNVILGRGLYKIPLMIINNLPSEYESKLSIPLVSTEGAMLELMLSSLGIKSQSCYVTNLVKCYDSESLKLSKKDIYKCYQHLYNEMITLQPTIVISLGIEPFNLLTGLNESISNVVGSFIPNLRLKLPCYIGKRVTKKIADYLIYNQQFTFDLLPLYHPSQMLSRSANKTTNWKALSELLLPRLLTLDSAITEHTNTESPTCIIPF